MKKMLSLFALLLFVASASAQTSTELVGNWKLVKWTNRNGKVMDINDFYKTSDVYQVFDADGKFQSIVGEKTHKGKWNLSEDNKTLTISVMLIKEAFDITYFDAKKRVIKSQQLGTFEYEKVAD
jgi:hypothetical protein